MDYLTLLRWDDRQPPPGPGRDCWFVADPGLTEALLLSLYARPKGKSARRRDDARRDLVFRGSGLSSEAPRVDGHGNHGPLISQRPAGSAQLNVTKNADLALVPVTLSHDHRIDVRQLSQ